jgi:hypothetical protein
MLSIANGGKYGSNKFKAEAEKSKNLFEYKTISAG